MTSNDFDVAILGGGYAGLTLALQLKKYHSDVSVTVLERSPHPVPEAAHKVGESTVEVAAHYLVNVLGLGEHIKSAQLPKLGLRCFFNSSTSKDVSNRLELGANCFFPRKTYQLDRGRFENHLGKIAAGAGVSFADEVSVRKIEISRDAADHRVSYDRRGESGEVTCRWVIDASGRAALLKRTLDLDEPCPHQINAVWFRIGEKISLDDWSSEPEWTKENFDRTSRWFSTNHLMAEGYWVWVIPLSSGSTSVGIVADPRHHPLHEMNSFEKALDWLHKHEPQCAARVELVKGKLQDFLALKHYARRAKQVFSSDRWGLTGDAGVFIDPLYSPGGDFIAFANTWLCDLIGRERKGKQIRELTKLYDDLYRSFADNTFQLYQDQYALLGNAQVMPLKIIWDFALYWSFFAFVFTQEKLCDLSVYIRVRDDLLALSKKNKEMQAFFQAVHQKEKEPKVARSFIDLSKIPYLYKLNEDLTMRWEPTMFEQELSRRIAALNALGDEIVDGVAERYPELARESASGAGAARPVLEDVFEKLAWRMPEELKQAQCG